jgi:SHS2 domain-containing protein
MRYEYLDEVTSDQIFKAYGYTLEEVLVNAAMAMFGVMYNLEEIVVEDSINVEAMGSSEEKLLYNWLSNLLVEFEVEGVFFADFSVDSVNQLEDNTLHAIGTARGSRNMPQLQTHVKGVTLHRFSLEKINNQFVATVVVDV